MNFTYNDFWSLGVWLRYDCNNILQFPKEKTSLIKLNDSDFIFTSYFDVCLSSYFLTKLNDLINSNKKISFSYINIDTSDFTEFEMMIYGKHQSFKLVKIIVFKSFFYRENAGCR